MEPLNDEHAQLLASFASAQALQHSSSMQMAGQLAENGFFDALGQGSSSHVEALQGPIQAYAKIDFPGFSIYLQTLEVTIGRRPAHLVRQMNSQQPRHIDGKTRIDGDVDIDLGRVKAISRLHAVIYYHSGPFHPRPYPEGESPEMADPRGIAYGAYSWQKSNQQLRDVFVIRILGKHGAMVDDVYIRQGGVVQLGKRTKIQIAERVFYFVLPPNVTGPPEQPYAGQNLDSLSASEDESEGDTLQEDVDMASDEEEESRGQSSELSDAESGAEGSQAESGTEKEEAATNGSVQKKRPKLILKRKTVAGKGKGKGKAAIKAIKSTPQPIELNSDESDNDVEEVVPNPSSSQASASKMGSGASPSPRKGSRREALPAWTQGAGVAARKRKRGDPISDEEALAVGTPIGIEALEAEKRAKNAQKRLAKAQELRETAQGDASKEAEAARLENSVKVESSSLSEAGQSTEAPPAKASKTETKGGKAKGGKSTRANADQAQAEKSAKPDTQPESLPEVLPPASAAPALQPAADETATQAVLPTVSASQEPEELVIDTEKPKKSNVELLTTALTSPESMSNNGKMTMPEIFGWLEDKWVWFKNNGKHTDKDWQASLKGAISASKEFIKIPRKPGEPGKGPFYTLTKTELGQTQLVELRRVKAEAAAKAEASAQRAAQADAQATVGSIAATNTATGYPAMPATTPPVTSSAASHAANTAASAGSPTPRPAGSAAPSPSMPHLSRPPVQRPTGSSPFPPPMGGHAATAIRPPSIVPLVLGPPPPDAIIPKRPQAAPGSMESFLTEAPIVPHGNKWFLSKAVFGHLSPVQLREIEGMGQTRAMATLQGLIIEHLKFEHLKFKNRQQQLAQGPVRPPPNAVNGRPLAGHARPPTGAFPPRPMGPGPSTQPPGQMRPNAYPPAMRGAPGMPRPPPPNGAVRPPYTGPQANASMTGRPPPMNAPLGPANARPEQASNPFSALMALSSHPEAAGLMEALKQQASSGTPLSLTPGQIELLQQANQMSAGGGVSPDAGGSAIRPGMIRPPLMTARPGGGPSTQRPAGFSAMTGGQARPPTGPAAGLSPRPPAGPAAMSSPRPFANGPSPGASPRVGQTANPRPSPGFVAPLPPTPTGPTAPVSTSAQPTSSANGNNASPSAPQPIQPPPPPHSPPRPPPPPPS